MVKKCISIGTLSIQLIYLLIIPFLRLIRFFSLKLLEIKDPRKKHPFITTWIMFIAIMLAGCLQVVIIIQKKKIERRNMIQRESNDNHSVYLVNKVSIFPEENNNIIICFFIISAAALDLISTGIEFFLTQSMSDPINLKFQMKPIELIFTCLLCHYFLKYKLYRHHYVSIIGICLSVILITYRSYESVEWQMFLIIISFNLISIQNVIEKYLIQHFELSIYIIMFFEGLIGFLLSLITIIVLSYINCPPMFNYCKQGGYLENPIEFLNSLTLKNGLFVFGIDVLTLAGINIFSFLINQAYSPTHLIISDVIVSFIDWLLVIIIESREISRLTVILELLEYVVLLMSCLVYNEIIILYCCRLNKYTISRLSKLSKKEDSQLVAEALSGNNDRSILPDDDSRVLSGTTTKEKSNNDCKRNAIAENEI